MKIVILNGSPRKNWNLAQILKEAQKGAADSGAETAYIDLYDLNYNGCRSCLACKRKGIAEPCRCYWKDELSPALEQIWQCDRLITGTPVYFGEPAGGFRSFIERVTFPALSYNNYSSVFKGHVDVDIFVTMNASSEMYERSYAKKFQEEMGVFGLLNGEVRLFPVFDTLQVKDYSKYEMAGFAEEHKKTVHENEFPKTLKLAYQIGKGQGIKI